MKNHLFQIPYIKKACLILKVVASEDKPKTNTVDTQTEPDTTQPIKDSFRKEHNRGWLWQEHKSWVIQDCNLRWKTKSSKQHKNLCEVWERHHIVGLNRWIKCHNQMVCQDWTKTCLTVSIDLMNKTR